MHVFSDFIPIFNILTQLIYPLCALLSENGHCDNIVIGSCHEDGSGVKAVAAPCWCVCHQIIIDFILICVGPRWYVLVWDVTGSKNIPKDMEPSMTLITLRLISCGDSTCSWEAGRDFRDTSVATWALVCHFQNHRHYIYGANEYMGFWFMWYKGDIKYL